MANTVDPLILSAQQWLNATYGGDSRYNIITENGKTGWTTIYALTRALQIELGITSTSDNFGPTTTSRFNAIYPNGISQQSSSDATEENIYAIIQGALFCKGYSTGVGTVTKHFYDGTGNAIKSLKEDAGCASTTSTVTLNVMKALLSMDYFYSYDTSENTQNIQTIQRYLNSKYEAYIGLKPCDGVYGRGTNSALIYAIQAEEGMSTSVANGNFGPSTKRCCPTIPYSNVETSYIGNVYSATSISKFTKLLKMGLYVNGIGNGDFDGALNSSLVEEFQEKYSLPETGVCNLATWLSVFISSGDITRSAIACDCATILTAEKAQTLYNNGYRYVGRYLSGTIGGGISKALSISEMQIAFSAGLRIFPIHQSSANMVSYFSEEQAQSDIWSAYDHARKLGIPTGTTIYFAVDCDPQDSEIISNIIPYFKELNDRMKNDFYGEKYKIGIYGTRNVCAEVSNLGYTSFSFVSDMSTGFSGNLGFKIPDNWAFDQFTTVTLGSGTGQIEIDKNGFSGRDNGIGADALSSFSKVVFNLQQIFNLAMTYTNNNQNNSSKLVMNYLRYKGNYGINSSSGTNSMWSAVAGNIDMNFCSIVNQELGNVDLDFLEPVNRNVYDVCHLAAVIQALNYPAAGLDLDLFDELCDIFAGWGGDMVSFTDNIKIMDGTNVQNWANENICKENNTKFPFEDYMADIDAINIHELMEEQSLSFNEAFTTYFTVPNSVTGKVMAETRTTIFINSTTFNIFLEQCLLVNANAFPQTYFRENLTDEEGITNDHYSISMGAFVQFVNNEYQAGR